MFRVVVFAVVVLGCQGASIATSDTDNAPAQQMDFLTQKIYDLLENLRGQMKEGAPDLGIPPLDPLYIEMLNLSSMNIGDVFQIDKALFEKVTITDLPNFVIEYVKASILSLNLNLNLSFEQITANGHYDLDASVMNVIPVYGKGPFLVGLYNVLIGGKAVLGSKEGKIFIDTLKLHGRVGHVSIFIDGLLGGGDLGVELNGLIQTLGTDIVNKYIPKLSDTFSEFARNKINDAIKYIDFSSIIGKKKKIHPYSIE